MARQSLPSRAIDRETQKAYRGSITRAHCFPVAPATGSFHFESTKGAHVCSLESSKSPPKPENHTNWHAIQEKVLPILKKQSGFVDETVLTSDMESNRVLALSFWKKNGDAER